MSGTDYIKTNHLAAWQEIRNVCMDILRGWISGHLCTNFLKLPLYSHLTCDRTCSHIWPRCTIGENIQSTSNISFQLWVLVKENVKSAPEKLSGHIVRTEMTQGAGPTLISSVIKWLLWGSFVIFIILEHSISGNWKGVHSLVRARARPRAWIQGASGKETETWDMTPRVW